MIPSRIHIFGAAGSGRPSTTSSKGPIVSSTALALKLARLQEISVEDLFYLVKEKE